MNTIGKYGIQMYSLRDITGEDLEGALEKVANIGYKYVEFAGFFGHSAKDVAAMLDKNGLTCSGTHSGIWDLLSDFDSTVAYHKEIGNKNYIIPGEDLSTNEKLDRFIENVNILRPKLAAEGITLAYHNHSHEFIKTPYGKFIHQELETRTEIDFEIDTYWAYNAGLDPIETLERLKDRVHIIHIKDGTSKGEGRVLGRGSAPVADVHKKAIECGMLEVVESETLDPNGETEARLCFEELVRLDSLS